MQFSLSSKWFVFFSFVLCWIVACAPSTALGQDKKPAISKKEDAKANQSEPKSRVTPTDKSPDSPSDVKTKTIKLSGVFEAVTASELTVGTENLSHLEIKSIVPHGTSVEAGKTIVFLSTKEIDKQIKKAEEDFRLAKLTMQQDELAYEQFLKSQELDRKAAERSRKSAQQSFDNFMKVDRQRQIDTAKQNLKSAKASLENVTEELNQLEQMYKEDDLTEESEEIVLKRAKESVDYAKFRLRGTEISSNRTLTQTIPRSEAEQKDALERAQMTYRKAVQDLEIARTRRDIEIRRKRDEHNEKETKLEELVAERSKVALRAKNGGIVFYGKLNRGKLSDKPSPLKVGDKVTPDQVIATIADPGKLQVRLDIAEKDLASVVVGAKCTIKPQAFPQTSINAKVKSIASVPYVSGKYDCVISWRKSKNQPTIIPTMTCNVEFEVEAKE